MKVKYDRKINYLKALAIFLVVLGHSITYYSTIKPVSNFYKMTEYIIYSINVPLFFIVSGYLCHKQNQKNFLIKKIKRIYIPFITFTILKLIYSNFISAQFSHSSNFIIQLIDAFIFGNLYWFSYSILTMYFIISLLWNIKKVKNRKLIILILTIISIIYSSITDILNISIIPNIFQINKTIQFLPYFLLGYYLNIEKRELTIPYNKNLTFLSIIFIHLRLKIVILKR